MDQEKRRPSGDCRPCSICLLLRVAKLQIDIRGLSCCRNSVSRPVRNAKKAPWHQSHTSPMGHTTMLDRMTDAKTNRLTSIDALRGIAALSVLLYHDFIALPAGPLIKGSEALNRFIMTSAGYGRTGVFLFFVLSGFCIHLR